jgi:hypothetical protein
MTTIDKIRLFERDAGRLMGAALVISVVASVAAVALSQTRLRPWAAMCGAVAGMGVLSAGAALHLKQEGEYRREMLEFSGPWTEDYVGVLENRAKWVRDCAFVVTLAAAFLGCSLGYKKMISTAKTGVFCGIGGMGLLGMWGAWRLQRRGFDIKFQVLIDTAPRPEAGTPEERR